LFSKVTQTVQETIDLIRKGRIKCLKKKYNREHLKFIKKHFDELWGQFPLDGHPKTCLE
jgi:hypothetical protein